MAKKLPTGWSVKTIPEEMNLVEMYRYEIHHGDLVVETSFIKYDDRTEAREEGVKKLWELQD